MPLAPRPLSTIAAAGARTRLSVALTQESEAALVRFCSLCVHGVSVGVITIVNGGGRRRLFPRPHESEK